MSDFTLTTTSSRSGFRKCPRYYRLAYVDRWRAVKTSDALHVGTAVHVGLEAWWGAESAHDAGYDSVLAVHNRGRDAYQQARIDAMLIGYSERWRSSRSDFSNVQVEVQFEGPVIDPDDDHVSLEWKQGGKIDALAFHVPSDADIVIEHKTTSEEIEGDDANYWQKLSMDDQCSAYVVGSEVLARPASFVLYDVIRKPSTKPKLATPVEKRRFKKRTKKQVTEGWSEDDPRLYYANTRLTDETPEAYFNRIMADIRERPERYYQRKLVPRTDWQVREFLRDVWAITKQIDHANREDAFPRNPNSCHQYGRCQFWDVCSIGVKPEEHPDRFEKKASAHEELEEEVKDDGDEWFAEFDQNGQEAHAR